jgi:hypothetical protein
VQHYEKKLYGTDISPKQAVIIALDDSQTAQLASDIIFKADGLSNWLNCATKLGLAADVKAIKHIER